MAMSRERWEELHRAQAEIKEVLDKYNVDLEEWDYHCFGLVTREEHDGLAGWDDDSEGYFTTIRENVLRSQERGLEEIESGKEVGRASFYHGGREEYVRGELTLEGVRAERAELRARYRTES